MSCGLRLPAAPHHPCHPTPDPPAAIRPSVRCIPIHLFHLIDSIVEQILCDPRVAASSHVPKQCRLERRHIAEPPIGACGRSTPGFRPCNAVGDGSSSRCRSRQRLQLLLRRRRPAASFSTTDVPDTCSHDLTTARRSTFDDTDAAHHSSPLCAGQRTPTLRLRRDAPPVLPRPQVCQLRHDRHHLRPNDHRARPPPRVRRPAPISCARSKPRCPSVDSRGESGSEGSCLSHSASSTQPARLATQPPLPLAPALSAIALQAPAAPVTSSAPPVAAAAHTAPASAAPSLPLASAPSLCFRSSGARYGASARPPAHQTTVAAGLRIW